MVIFGILTFQSCQKEEVFEENLITNEHNVKLNYVSFESLKENKQLTKKISKISKVFDINKNRNSSDNNITILTDEIIETYVDSIYSYSFRIENPIDNTAAFENLVIMNDINTTDYYYYIYRYHFKDNIEEDEDFPYSFQVIPVDEDEINFNDFDITRTVEIYCVGVVSARDFEVHWNCEVSEYNNPWPTNGTSNNYMINTNNENTTIDVSNYQNGIYAVILVCDGQIVDSKNLIIE